MTRLRRKWEIIFADPDDHQQVPADAGAEVDAVLRLISIPIQQQILLLLHDRSRVVSDLVEQLGRCFAVVSKNLGDLEAVGLVGTRKWGRQRFKHLTNRARITSESGMVRFDLSTPRGGEMTIVRSMENVDVDLSRGHVATATHPYRAEG